MHHVCGALAAPYPRTSTLSGTWKSSTASMLAPFAASIESNLRACSSVLRVQGAASAGSSSSNRSRSDTAWSCVCVCVREKERVDVG
jgi:hypothetical protein